MDTEYMIEYLLVNVFYVYLVFWYMNIFLGRLESVGWNAWLFCIVFYILNSGGQLLWHHPFINLGTSIGGIFLVSCLFEVPWLKRIMSVFMIYGICALCDILVATLVGDYVIGRMVGVEINIIEYLVMFCIVVVMKRYLQSGNIHIIFGKQLIAGTCVPLISIVILLVLITNRIHTQRVVAVIAIGLLYMNLLVFYLYDNLNNEYEIQQRNQILEYAIYEYQNQMLIMDISQRKIDSLRHDFKHHIRALEGLATDGDHEKIISYIKNMRTFVQYEREYVRSGNKEMDSILNYFIQKAIDEGLVVRSNVKVGMQMEIDFFDLNILLANLLENAIEAAVQTEDKKIDLGIELEKGVLFIELKNSCRDKINVFLNGKIKTSKADKKRHGYGFQNIKMIVEKYQGELDTNVIEGTFYVNMVLYLKI